MAGELLVDKRPDQVRFSTREAGEEAVFGEIVEEGLSLILVDAESLSHRLLLVIVSLYEWLPRHVILTSHSWWVEHQVINSSTTLVYVTICCMYKTR